LPDSVTDGTNGRGRVGEAVIIIIVKIRKTGICVSEFLFFREYICKNSQCYFYREVIEISVEYF